MSLSTSPLSYKDCMDFLDMAMDERIGARMYFRTEQEARYFQMRCNQARTLDRDENKKIHEPGTPLYGKSTYDELVISTRMSPDGWWCYAKKISLDTSRVEPIQDEDYPMIDVTPVQQQIEDQSEPVADEGLP